MIEGYIFMFQMYFSPSTIWLFYISKLNMLWPGENFLHLGLNFQNQELHSVTLQLKIMCVWVSDRKSEREIGDFTQHSGTINLIFVPSHNFVHHWCHHSLLHLSYLYNSALSCNVQKVCNNHHHWHRQFYHHSSSL